MTSVDSGEADRFDNSANVTGRSADSRTLALLVWLSELSQETADGNFAKCGGYPSGELPPIGTFRLEAILGKGAYGVVFRAFDTELGRQVALKVAWPHVMFDAISSRRFIEEPKAAASLQHPGIVQVYKSGWLDAVCFIALELVEGPNLAEWLKDQPRVPFRLAAELMRKPPLQSIRAHVHGVIHRDLKPSNILLSSNNAQAAFPYVPLVTDFGLARRSRNETATNLTATHDVLGSDPYIAPEQLESRKSEPIAASDIFSLGVILFELVTGRRPFDGETAEETRYLIRSAGATCPPIVATQGAARPRNDHLEMLAERIESALRLCTRTG